MCANLILVCVGGCLESEICETGPFGEGCEQCQETCFQEARDQNATECVDCTQGCTITTVDCSELCFTQVGADCEEACVLGCEDQNTTTIVTYDDILLSWESEVINYMAQNRIQDSTRFEYLFTRSVDDLVDEASEGDAAPLPVTLVTFLNGKWESKWGRHLSTAVGSRFLLALLLSWPSPSLFEPGGLQLLLGGLQLLL